MKFATNIYIIIILIIITAFSSVITTDAAATYTIVIDAGHGGKDPGAIDNGVKEKDINLGVALLLGEMIKKNRKDIKVVYTRDKDIYLTLQQRVNKANDAQGDLFISIHVNSVDKKNKNRRIIAGSSVYTLGLDKGEENMEVARRENAVISLESNYDTKYQGFNPDSDESYIIFEMAQKDNMNQSILFANNIQQQLVKVASRKDRGVRQAGFWVLWATSMPAVLIELDFICNPNSAKYIASQTGQKKLAEGIFNAVESYFEQLANVEFIEETPNNEVINTEINLCCEGAILEPIEIRKNKSTYAPYYSNTGQNQKRRRRSESSRQISANREIEIAMLQPSPVVYTEDNIDEFNTPIQPLVIEDSTTIVSSEVNNQEDLDLIVNVQENNNIDFQEIMPEESQIPKKKKNRGTRPSARLNTYYTIMLFESSEHLMDNDPRLEGLTSVKIKESDNGTYLYICGEYYTKSDVTESLNRIITKFPEATIIKVNKGTNKIIN